METLTWCRTLLKFWVASISLSEMAENVQIFTAGSHPRLYGPVKGPLCFGEDGCVCLTGLKG